VWLSLELLNGIVPKFCRVGAAGVTTNTKLPNPRERPCDPSWKNIEREIGMHTQRNFLLFIALAGAFATPALGQTATSGGPVSVVATAATSIPDFSRVWLHPAFPWFEPPASGPGPVTNKSRWPQRPGDASGWVALSPLLQAWKA
jgi:hypothetical protein